MEPTPAPPFTAVIIDFFGTLTTSTTDDVWFQAAAASAVPLGLPAAQWRSALDDSFAERATGVLGGLPETFRELARRCGSDPSDDDLAAACRARVDAHSALFDFRPDAVGALAALKARGLRLGLLSDCTPELPVAWPTFAVAPYFDATAFSCDERLKKPDPAFFQRICDRLGVAPAHCLYLGDGGSRELSGAAAVGMTPFMLRAEDWQHNSAHDREDDWSGPEIGSFTELVDLVDRLNASRASC